MRLRWVLIFGLSLLSVTFAVVWFLNSLGDPYFRIQLDELLIVFTTIIFLSFTIYKFRKSAEREQIKLEIQKAFYKGQLTMDADWERRHRRWLNNTKHQEENQFQAIQNELITELNSPNPNLEKVKDGASKFITQLKRRSALLAKIVSVADGEINIGACDIRDLLMEIQDDCPDRVVFANIAEEKALISCLDSDLMVSAIHNLVFHHKCR